MVNVVANEFLAKITAKRVRRKKVNVMVRGAQPNIFF